MKDQYVGDVSDLLKFSFLHFLAETGYKIGIAWYYNPGHDGRSDGLHREYCSESKWASLDPIFSALRTLTERSVAAAEQLSIWPKETFFYAAPVPYKRAREKWAQNMRESLERADLVLLDPDNGIGTTRRHTTLSEISSMRRSGRSIIIIKFPGRQEFAGQVRRHHNQLRDGTGTVNLFTVMTRVLVSLNDLSKTRVPRFRWFTVIDHDGFLIDRARAYVKILNEIEGVQAGLVLGAECPTFCCRYSVCGKDERGAV